MARNNFHFCFTLNNYTSEDEQRIWEAITPLSKYAVIGREVGEGGTPHLQGYVSFSRRRTFRFVSDLLGSRCHIEVARGTQRQNQRYCTKGGEFREHGAINEGRNNERRKELANSFAESIRGGNQGLVEFAREEPDTWFFHGHNLLRNALSIEVPIERPGINVRWIYGPPGVGKSRRAHEELPDAYIKEPRTKWWNGYLLQKHVIIDDFGPGGIDINHLLRWFDRYKCIVENKGGMIPLHADTFIVTSNFHPESVFKWGDEVNPQLPALLRRIQLIEMN